MKNQHHQEVLSALYLEHFGKAPDSIKLIPPSGSDRRYFTLNQGAQKAIGVYGQDQTENNTFFYFTNLFRKHKLPVPEVYQRGSRGYYITEYVGDESLFDILQKEGTTDRVKKLFKKTIDQLVRFHWEMGGDVDYSMCYAAPEFDKEQIFADLLYFKYYFLDLQKLSYDRPALVSELHDFADTMAGARPQTFMYRDFQSRNVMVQKDEVFFIDYQGGMLGLPQYDIASLLWQARAQLPLAWKDELLRYYFEAVERLDVIVTFNEHEFRKTYLDCVLLRILQTLGAYGFRGLIEGRAHFIKSIAPALHQLALYLDQYPGYPVYNGIGTILQQLVQPANIAKYEHPEIEGEETGLTIKIYSFSYKNGTASDLSGNGGGFVFDCRGILNPGRIDEYKLQTGMQAPVQQYLQHNTRMPEFLESVKNLVSISIEDYVARDFKNLSISFGCTGGQHRSVYAAEQLAVYIEEKYGLKPQILHMEQQEHSLQRLR